MTTRKPRKGEISGRSYHFFSVDKFLQYQEEKLFVETTHIYGNYYGTLRQEMTNAFNLGFDVVTDTDIAGAKTMKDLYPNQVVLTLVLPPSMEELKARLIGRGNVDDNFLRQRLCVAQQEITDAEKFYDYAFANDKVEQSVDNLKSIIMANRLSIRR